MFTSRNGKDIREQNLIDPISVSKITNKILDIKIRLINQLNVLMSIMKKSLNFDNFQIILIKKRIEEAEYLLSLIRMGVSQYQGRISFDLYKRCLKFVRENDF